MNIIIMHEYHYGVRICEGSVSEGLLYTLFCLRSPLCVSLQQLLQRGQETERAE